MRSTRTALTLLFVLASCRAGVAPPTRTGDGLSASGTPPSGTAPGTPGTTPGGTSGQGTGAVTTPGTHVNRGEVKPYPDGAGVGDMARRYLQASPAKRLTVEIDFVRGRRPSDNAIQHVREILVRETSKQVIVAADDEFPPGDGTYSFAEIAALERAHRDTHSSGTTATMWIVYLDGALQDEEATIGIAITASTAAVFDDRIEEARTPILGSNAIERSVLTHEVGHLLALVNIGYASRHDHEDPKSRGHSNSRESVMFASIEDVGLIGLISGGPPQDFDPDDRDDLAMLRAA